MVGKLVWIVDLTGEWPTLTCGHTTRENGRPTAFTHQPAQAGDAWWCALCGSWAIHKLDQVLAAVAELRRQQDG
ncbi:MAG TPA: hypothetical protein VFE37_29480 [Chloroflexota bacterium]|nr:hypothetical protein [Chloroflexota bacterium]